jgi:hypothetical protein
MWTVWEIRWEKCEPSVDGLWRMDTVRGEAGLLHSKGYSVDGYNSPLILLTKGFCRPVRIA